MRRGILFALWWITGASCSRSSSEQIAASSAAGAAPPAVSAHAAPADSERGRTLLAKYQCARCHEGTEEPVPAPGMQCVGCHRDILSDRVKVGTPDDRKTWKGHLKSLNAAPSLVGVAARLQPSWLERFFIEPTDVRPALPASMPRLRMPLEDARDLAAFLTRSAPAEQVARLPGDRVRGRDLYVSKECWKCHSFSGANAPLVRPNDAPRDAELLAPDLRFTRDRWLPSAVAAWIQNPKAMKSDTLMETGPITDAEARDLAAYVLDTPLDPVQHPAAPVRLPPLARRVTYSEVRARVLGKTCIHCHEDSNNVMGDGGPGNTGGFGFPGRQVHLADYPHTQAGYVDARGERRSLFAADADGTPHLVAVLMARHDEVAGKPRPDMVGMPLGFPPIALEDIQLVESWIAQGRPE